MTKPALELSQFHLKNFKAVRDSKPVRFTPLTVFIGNNGVGKSSLIEGMEMVKLIREEGLDQAMQHWRGFEYIWNKAAPHSLKMRESKECFTNQMSFRFAGTTREGLGQNAVLRKFRALTEVTAGLRDEVFFLSEELHQETPGRLRSVTRPISGQVKDETRGQPPFYFAPSPNESILSAETSIARWQFVRLDADAMGRETPLRRVSGYLPLATNGSNIAEYLLDIRDRDPGIVDGIVETMQNVLPYLVDVKPIVTSEIGRSVYLELVEQKFKLPSWLFSTGTLRVVALLALLRHPDPPPLIVVEEIENGLDPRTINLIVEEIREVVSTSRSQIILTTHSPYLLDLIPLSSLIFVERIDGQPTFIRPEDDASVQRWSQDFAPGRLYTMGRFQRSQ